MNQRISESAKSINASRTSHHALLVVILLSAFALRVVSLSSQSVWWDEAFTWQITSHGWSNLWHTLQTGDRNPPLYFLSLMGWGSVAGWSEFSLRFLSVAWMMIGLAFTFNLTRRLYSFGAGIFALVLAAVSPALVVYAQEARMYAAFFALTAATLYFGSLILDAGASRRYSVAFLIAETLLLLTHYFAIPLVATMNILALIVLVQRHARFSSFVKWIVGQVLVVIPLAIWTLIVFTTPGSLINAREIPPDLASFLGQVGVLWLSGVRDLSGEGGAILPAALLWFIVVAMGAARTPPMRTRLSSMFGILAVALAYAMTNALTSFHPRYLLPYVLPFYALTGDALSGLSAGVQRLKPNRWRLSISADLVLGGITACLVFILLSAGWQLASSPQNAKDDARSVAAYLNAHATADDVILVEANDYTLAYYDHGPAQTKMITATTEADALSQLDTAIGERRHVWHVHWRTSTQDQRGYWPFLFNQSGWLTDWQSFQGYEVYRYELPTHVYNPPLNENRWDFGSFVSPRQSALSVTGNGVMTMVVDWQPTTTSDPIWQRSSLALVDQAGRAIYKFDADLHDGLNYYVLPIPPGTPPISHTVTLKLYNAQTASHELPISIIVPHRTTDSDPYRTLSGYHWQKPLTPIDNLESYSLSTSSPTPLSTVEVIMHWRKTTSTLDGHMRLAQADRAWAEIPSDVLDRAYPFSQWADGEVVVERRTLTYPPVRGETQLQIRQGDQWLTLATLKLDEAALKFDVPKMQTTQATQFGTMAELLGYDLKSNSIAADRPLDLTLYWRAANIAPITTTYTVFTQLIAPDGHLVAQHDAPPDPSTTAWVPGQIVIDSHALKVVDPTYRGPAALIVGWYNSASVVRVPVAGGGNFVTLATPIQVQDR